MATKTPRKTPSRSTFLDELADAFGPPKKQPKEIPSSGKSEVFGIPAEMLSDENEDEGTTVRLTRSVAKCWGKPRGKGRNSDVAFPAVTRDNPAIKELADTPATANRFCVIRDGKPFQPKRPLREADPRWLGDLGSLRECRFALTALYLQPPIEAIGVFDLDGKMVAAFPVDPNQAPDVAQAPVTPKSGESENFQQLETVEETEARSENFRKLENVDAVGGGVQ